MPRVAVLHHLEEAATGYAGEVLRAAGLELDERDLPRGDPLPALERVDGLVSLGGRQSLRHIESFPYLEAEVDLLRSALDRELPLLGVCLGAQLLARACGAEIRALPARRIGWAPVRRLPGAEDDPVFEALPPTIAALHWNEDCFEVPEAAVELLSRSDEGGEAIRVGPRAWGVQFHPEVDPPLLDEWYRRGGDALAAAGVDEAAARVADERFAAAQRDLAERLFGSFAEVALRG